MTKNQISDPHNYIHKEHRQHLGMEFNEVTNDFASGVYIEFRFRFQRHVHISETSCEHISETYSLPYKRNLYLISETYDLLTQNRTEKLRFLLNGQEFRSETWQGCRSGLYAQHIQKSAETDRENLFDLTKNSKNCEKYEKDEEEDEIGSESDVILCEIV